MMTGQAPREMPSERVIGSKVLCQAGRHDWSRSPGQKARPNRISNLPIRPKEQIQSSGGRRQHQLPAIYGEGSSGRLPWRWSDLLSRRMECWNTLKMNPSRPSLVLLDCRFSFDVLNGFVAHKQPEQSAGNHLVQYTPEAEATCPPIWRDGLFEETGHI